MNISQTAPIRIGLESRCSIKWTTLALVALVLVANRAAGNGMTTGMCECDGDTYHLGLGDGNAEGTFTKTPDKTEYIKGEIVIVTYNPPSDYVFTNWTADPPSNIASDSSDLTTAVTMTADTSLVACTVPKDYSLYVTWYPQYGSVSVPSGATSGSQYGMEYFLLPVEYGEHINLSATPGLNREVVWKNNPHLYYNLRYYDLQFSNAVSVKVRGDMHLEVEFRGIASAPRYTGSTIVEGGNAQIYTTGAQPSDHEDFGSFFTAPAQSTPHNFSAQCVPDPGYHFICWTWNDGPGTIFYPHLSTRSEYRGADTEYTAYVTPGIRLAVQIEGQGVAISDEFQATWNPWPMIDLGEEFQYAPQYNIFANQVNVEYRACPGWVFDHWEVLREDAEWETVLDENENPLRSPFHVFMNWYESEPGQRRVPAGMSIYYLKAVFEPWCDCDGPNGADIIRKQYENPDVLDRRGEMFLNRPECSDLVTGSSSHEQAYVNPGDLPFEKLSCNHDFGIPDPHTGWEWDNGVSELFQRVRDAYGNHIEVTSAYRCPRKAIAVRSKSTSQHTYGRAFDCDQGSSAANWALALVARDLADVSADRIFLYYGTASMSLAVMTSLGHNATNLPDEWEEYTNVHCDETDES